MGMREAFHVAEASNKPIVDIGPSEGGLNGFQQEDEISCSNFALTLQSFRVISKTNLRILRIVGHLENCSYIRLNVDEWLDEVSRDRPRTDLGAEDTVQSPVK